MNKKEIGELSRRWRPDRCAVGHIYGCYVSAPDRRIVADMDESLAMLPQEEAELFLGLLKKTLSGSLGRNLIDIVFSTAQVADSDEHRLLMELRNTKLKSAEARKEFYNRVIDCVDMEENYLILMAADSYDVPHKGKDGSVFREGSDEVFTYFLCGICPVKENKVSLSYFPGDNEFHSAGGRTASLPELGFLFPAFDDRAANIYNALFYAKKPAEPHMEFIEGIFRTEPPLSAADQRESFVAALTDALGDECSLDVVQTMHGQLAERIAEHRESRDPERLALTPREIGVMLRKCGVEEDRAEEFEKQCAGSLGEGASISPENILNTGKFEVRTAEAKLSVTSESSYTVETRMIDGRRYILIPAGSDVEVNGIPVRFAGDTNEEE